MSYYISIEEWNGKEFVEFSFRENLEKSEAVKTAKYIAGDDSIANHDNGNEYIGYAENIMNYSVSVFEEDSENPDHLISLCSNEVNLNG